jgi:glycosyltransferase 2 family protein
MSAARFKKFLGPLKWVFALALLYFVLRSGKIDFGQLRVFVKSPTVGLFCCALTFFWYGICFLRWKILLKSQQIFVSFKTVFHLGMLGQFFQTFMPGTVGADLAKALYIGKRYPAQKLKAIFSVVVDRGVGLYAILLLGALAFLTVGSHLSEVNHPLVHVIRSLGYLLTAVSLVGIVFVMFMPLLGNLLRSLGGRWPGFPAQLRRPLRLVKQVVEQYSNKTPTIATSIGLSLVTHSMAILMLYVIALKMYGPMPWGTLDLPRFVLAASLGLVVMALPISPNGLGVGQAAFASIFTALGVGNASFGASIVTAFQLVTLLVNLSGFVFFATHKQEVAEFENQAR